MAPALTLHGSVAAVLVLATAAAARAAAGSRHRLAVQGRLPGTGRRRSGEPAAGPRRRGPAALLLAAPSWLVVRVGATALPVSAALVWRAWLAGPPAAALVGLVAAGPGAAALAAVATAGAPALAWRLLRHRRQARLEAALPGTVEEIARGLRSGASLRQALTEASLVAAPSLGADLATVVTALERGAGLPAALESWAAARDLGGVHLVVAALCLGAETGGARAHAVDGVATTLRQRLAAQAEARALATQTRASAR